LAKLSFSLSFVEVNYSDHKQGVSFGKSFTKLSKRGKKRKTEIMLEEVFQLRESWVF